MEPIQSTEELALQEDVLHLAGSKMSLKDVLDRQMEIPTYNGRRYYKTEDIARVFVTMNGILTDVSKKAYSNKLRFEELQQELALKDDELHALKEALEAKDIELSTMISTSEADVLRDRIRSLESEKLDYQQESERIAGDIKLQLAELTRILEETQAELHDAQTENKSLKNELDNAINKSLEETSESLTDRMQLLQQLTDVEIENGELKDDYNRLRSDYECLQDAHDRLKELHVIATMKHEQMYNVAKERVIELQQRLASS